MASTLRASRWLIYAVLIGTALFMLMPLLVVVLNSFRTAVEIGRSSVIGWPTGFAWENYISAWGHYCIAQRCEGIKPYMWNSFALVIPATIISTLLGAIAGYSISLWRFRGDTTMYAIVVMGVFLPEQMKLIPWALVLRELGLNDTITALVLIHTVQGISFTTLFCRNYYVGIPQDLIKAAKVDGAGYFRIFWRIVMPLSPPILIVTVIWQFTGIWNDFLMGVTFTAGSQQPVTAALIAIATTAPTDVPQYGVQSAAVLLAALPTLLVYFLGGRYFLRGLTAGAVK
ncbi:MAG TPA: carbohydrate ABC transporter permease [Reyranella sp.]|nr:carbohydrate ABC transporter permease [Reyranella sp.]